MFGKKVKLFSLAGFSVSIDMSWLFLFAIIMWTLAVGFFPHTHAGLATLTYWWMAFAATVLLVVSIVLHELSHSLVARRYGLPIKGITLFIFGGVAEMEDEPASPRVEFMMAAAGPVASVFLAGVFYVIRIAFPWNYPTAAVLGYLVWINGLLAAFNLLPAFPLDGGRLFRSAVWAWKKNLQTATRIASSLGSGFAFLFMVLGVVWFFMNNLIGGIWWILIGLFLYRASQMSYKQLVVREALQGETVEHLMKKDPITVPPGTSILSFVDDYVYSHHFKLFPVVDSDRLVGCVTTRDVKNVPREKWSSTTVGDIARTCNGSNSIAPDTGVLEALALMNRERVGRLVVVDQGRLAGVLTVRDLSEYLSLKLDLESAVGSHRGAA